MYKTAESLYCAPGTTKTLDFLKSVCLFMCLGEKLWGGGRGGEHTGTQAQARGGAEGQVDSLLSKG